MTLIGTQPDRLRVARDLSRLLKETGKADEAVTIAQQARSACVGLPVVAAHVYRSWPTHVQ